MAIDITTAQKEIAKIYIAAFNRVPDTTGLSYWVDVYANKGASLDAIAQGFTQSAEYIAKYPPTQTNTAYVNAIYLNVFGRVADTAGSTFWVSKMTDGSLNHATMMNAILNAAAVNGSADGLKLANQTTFAVNAVLTHLDINAASTHLANVTSDSASINTATAATIADMVVIDAAAAAAVVAAAVAVAAAAAAVAAEATGYTFTLTTANDTYAGGTGPDTFNGTLSDGAATSTFNIGDTLNGGTGIDTLNISSAIVAVMSLTDANWVGISNIEKIMVNNNAGAGAVNFTTGSNFNTAFTTGGVNLTTAGGAGAITIDMATVPYTGVATIVATSSGAGDHVITTGSGAATVTSTTLAGHQTVNGTGLTSVNLTSNGAGNQLVGNSTVTTALTSVTLTQHGAGNQTVTSTSASDVTVTALNNGSAGNQNITTGSGNDTVNATNIGGTTNVISTGAGNDTITLYASGVATHNTITGGAGADTINLVSGANAAPDTIIMAAASMGAVGVNTSADTINNFSVANDAISLSLTGQTGSLVSNGTNVAVVAGASVVQHIVASTPTVIAATTTVVVLDGVLANAAAMITAIGGGTTTLTETTKFTANSDLVVVWSDGTNAHVSLVNDAHTPATPAMLASDLTATEVATLSGIPSVSAMASANFAFIA